MKAKKEYLDVVQRNQQDNLKANSNQNAQSDHDGAMDASAV